MKILSERELNDITKNFNYHPLIIVRSIEHAGSLGELFDILSSIPEIYPIVWDQSQNRWVSPMKKELDNGN